MLASLPVLAWVQYRWLGQVSDAERERMQANVRRSLDHFREDFDRDLTRAFLHFRVDQSINRSELSARYATLLDDWKATSPDPKLIKDLYWVDSSRIEAPGIYRLDSQGETEIDWPEGLRNWRDQLKSGSQSEMTSLNSVQLFLNDERTRETIKQTEIHISRPDATGNSAQATRVHRQDRALFQRGQRIIVEAPALAIPSSTVRAKDLANRRSDYLIATLDLDHICNERIPALIKKHFETNAGLDYEVAVLSRAEPSRVIYRSSSEIDVEIRRSNDGSSGLLSLRPDDLTSVLDSALSTATGVKDRIASSDRVTMKVVGTRGDKPPSGVAGISELEGYWEVFLKHKAGSLEIAVASVRRRSMALSLGVLGFLGASIVLLLVATRRAQRLAEQQINFVAGVSHELRTPLAVIRSAAENLADGYVATAEQTRKYGALIRDEGRRLTDMVEEVLEVAGVQSGKREYLKKPVDPRAIAEHAIAGCNLLIAERDFEVDLQIDSRVPMVNGDPSALARAVQNLITNGIKYSDHSKLLRVGVGSSLDGEQVRIEIEDFGVGISAADLPHIFEPFFRARDVVDAQIHGSGLGLSLVKHIIESHDGHISVESNPGRGTTFTILLPAIGRSQKEVSSVEGYEQTNPAH